MAIMKLVDVPELTEFAGTEKIYVNDNGTTKQIDCGKVVTAGGAGGANRVMFDYPETNEEKEKLVTMIENGTDLWTIDGTTLCKIIAFSWDIMCGSGHYLKGTVISGTTVKQITLALIYGDLVDRLDALLTYYD